MLTILEECILDEQPKLLFNYYALQKACWIVLANIESSMHDEFLAWLQAPNPNMNYNLTMVPLFIFQKDMQAQPGHQIMLMRAARVLREFLEEEGNDGLTGIDTAADESDIPELGPTTLWGILEPNHPTWNGECIHWGLCERQGETWKE